MRANHNPGRIAGLWYLLLIVTGPLFLIYIPSKLFVHGNAAATVNNIAAHEWLFRVGIIDELIGAVILIFLVLALYRLFRELNQHLAVLVVIFGGVMPSTIYFVDVVNDASVLSVVRDGAGFLSVFNEPQRAALAMLFLRLHDFQITATMLLAGIWLFPLAILVYRSGFVPRFLGIWLAIAGCGYVILFSTGILLPEYEDKVFLICQPAFFGELAFMLWLVVKGARPPALDAQPHCRQ
jgi:hypothetical protein